MLLFRSGRFATGGCLVWLLAILVPILITAAQVSAQSKARKRKQAGGAASATVSPGEQTLANIPLPIGHEAKSLVLPDLDGEGPLRGRLRARTAQRNNERNDSS